MRTTHTRKTRSAVVALAAALLAGGAGYGVTQHLSAAPGAAHPASGDTVALAGEEARPGKDGPCTPVDERKRFKIRSGWALTPETVNWENRADGAQKHTFTFTNAQSYTGSITGELSLTPAKQRKALKFLGNSLGYELALEASFSGTESIEYNVPARSFFVAKRGIWKETHTIKRFQRWSNCQERTTHLGNVTGVKKLYHTSSKKVRFPKNAGGALTPARPSNHNSSPAQTPDSLSTPPNTRQEPLTTTLP